MPHNRPQICSCDPWRSTNKTTFSGHWCSFAGAAQAQSSSEFSTIGRMQLTVDQVSSGLASEMLSDKYGREKGRIAKNPNRRSTMKKRMRQVMLMGVFLYTFGVGLRAADLQSIRWVIKDGLEADVIQAERIYEAACAWIEEHF